MTTHVWEPRANTYPTSKENIHIEFVGLMAFCPGHDKKLNRGRCEVGIINNVPDHDLVVKLWKEKKLVYQWGPKPASALRKQVFSLRVLGENPPGVFFYQRGNKFTRISEDDPRDFRWIVDFENEEFFGRPDERAKLKRDKRFTTPRFNLYDGVLYTFCKTGCKFKRERETPQNSLSLGQIAKRQAAHLHLEPGQKAQLLAPDLDPSEGILIDDNHYDILIANLCLPAKAAKCKDAVSDFHYYFQTYEPPLARPHFDLLLDTILPCPKDSCVSTPLDGDLTTTSDQAPCAASGFGGGGGLDYPF